MTSIQMFAILLLVFVLVLAWLIACIHFVISVPRHLGQIAQYLYIIAKSSDNKYN